jgi:anti-sigma-K factor RskA
MSTELHTLSGAYAIDALSAEEAEQFRRHLEECPACRDEVRELRQAAARMGAGEAVMPPSSLKARVLAAADQQPQLPPKVTPIELARSRRWTSRIAAAAAAVVLVVAAGFGISQLQNRDDRSTLAQPVAQVFEAPDAHKATVETSNGGKVTVATSRELGKMAVETKALPRLSEKQVYQIWAIHDETPVSAGLLEDTDDGAAMAMPSAGTQVAITIEPAGGSQRPTSEPIIAVDPASV